MAALAAEKTAVVKVKAALSWRRWRWRSERGAGDGGGGDHYGAGWGCEDGMAVVERVEGGVWLRVWTTGVMAAAA